MTLFNVWKKFLNVSLRIKLIGLAIFTTLFLGFVIIYFMFSFYNGEISHDAKFMSMVTGKHIAEDATNFILDRNVNRLNNLLRNEIKDNKSILYIFYRNNKGVIVASAFQKGFYLNIVNNNILTINNNRNHLSAIKLASAVYGKILDASVPVFNGKLGIIRVGVSLKRMKNSFFTHEAPLFYKYISLVLIFTAILLYLIFEIIAWRFLTPIVKLWEAAEKIKKGDYDVHVNTFLSDDEIGKLSKTFNEMALGLKDAENERIENENQRKKFISRIIYAQEEERKAISRGLHDRFGQFLVNLKIKLRMLDDINNIDGIKSKINEIRGDLTEGLGVMHDIAKNLRPSILDEMGLCHAINLYIGDTIKNNPDMKIDFHPINLENRRFGKNIEINIYRIVQEAILNVLQHACANSITIILENYEQKIRGIIEDNGAGFRYCDGNKEYLGINGMEERAKLLGGELTVESEINLGTVVKFYVPVENYSSECGEDNKGDDGNHS